MEQSFIIANRTDVGRVREVNEDSMVTFDSPNGRVVAVCDGMGGQAAGDVASRLACDIITDILVNNKFSTPTEAITRAIMAANQGIIHQTTQNPSLEGMGATCVMVIIKDGLVYYGWVGDSRIYYISNGSIRQLTRDQSYVQQLVDQGQISAEEAEHHPQKNQILNAIGLPNMAPPQLCTVPLSPEKGSVILLCSDGLSGMVSNEQMLNVVSDPKRNLQQKADLLVERALENGGTDNITVQLIHFGKDNAAGKMSDSMRDGNKLGMWALIGAAAVIIALLFVWLFTGNEEQPEPVVNAPQQEQKAAPAPQTPAPQAVEKKVTTVEKESNKTTQPKSQPKEPKDKKGSNGNAGANSQKSIFKDKKEGDEKTVEKFRDAQNGKSSESEKGQTLDDLMKKDK